MGEIWIQEKRNSPSWSGGTMTRRYRLGGSANDWDVMTFLLNNTPTVIGAQMREAALPALDTLWTDDAQDDGRYEAEVHYVQPSMKKFTLPEIGSVRIRGSTKGESIHMLQSLATVAAYGASGETVAVTDNGGLINVTDDGSVDGVDVGSGGLTFTVVKVFSASALPNLGTLFSLANPNHVNNAPITFTDTITGLTITLAAGECRYAGSDFGEPRADGGVEFSYDFVGLPNATGLSIGTITGIAKKGHEFVWPRCRPKALPRAMGKEPWAAYVERVYPEGNLALLGI
jgi:hypothetical protein